MWFAECNNDEQHTIKIYVLIKVFIYNEKLGLPSWIKNIEISLP